MTDDYLIWPALAGGMLIGVSATLLLWLLGRIAGISGIVNGLVDGRSDRLWRIMFILGLLLGGVCWWMFLGGDRSGLASVDIRLLLAGGFLVGIGTRLGGGCTSGHGVCGLGRLSLRSLVATCVFVLTGIVTVFVMRMWGGGA